MKDINDIKHFVPYAEGGRSYSNKRLTEWNSDDFVEFVFDNCDSNGNFVFGNFLDGTDYLNYIPKHYARVYLYGVWEVLKELINHQSRIQP